MCFLLFSFLPVTTARERKDRGREIEKERERESSERGTLCLPHVNYVRHVAASSLYGECCMSFFQLQLGPSQTFHWATPRVCVSVCMCVCVCVYVCVCV